VIVKNSTNINKNSDSKKISTNINKNGDSKKNSTNINKNSDSKQISTIINTRGSVGISGIFLIITVFVDIG
jgi:hypothetical protein